MDSPEIQAAIAAGEVAAGPRRARATDQWLQDRVGPSTLDMVSGQRALGGPVRAGAIYRWMEEGQELFVPRTDGMVVSNRELRAMRTASGGNRAGGISIGGITINAAPGQSPADIARAVRRELERLARQGRAALHDGGAHAF